MKKTLVLLLTLFVPLFSAAKSPKTLKPRVVILTDVSTWETDDSESLVRLLVYSDMVEIEAIIYTTGWSLDYVRDEFYRLIEEPIDAYAKDIENLMKRSAQQNFAENEGKQSIGYWPSAEYLHSRTMYGSTKRGMEFIGKDNISNGSNFIIELADERDERPLWVLAWGGANTLAQAIWQVQQSRSEDELEDFLEKIHLYAITDQDIGQEKDISRDVSSQYWLRDAFGGDLLYIWDECAWMEMCGAGRDNWELYAENIQSHASLGALYPKYKWGVEGDTPSFLHVLPLGLNDPTEPEQCSWAGYSKWGLSPDGVTEAYNSHSSANAISRKYFRYFYPASFNDFCARMDWAHSGDGNRNPVVIVNNKKGLEKIEIETSVGKTIALDAKKSYDPDGDSLSFRWWVQSEAESYGEDIVIQNSDSPTAKITIPSEARGESFHIICEVIDSGEPALTSYRRIEVEIED